jgi:transcriptional regulator with XRE-family HTH domain
MENRPATALYITAIPHLYYSQNVPSDGGEMTVGQEIRRIREDKGWSQAKLGVLSGAGPSGISQIETGRRNPSAGTLQRIAEALEVEVRDLFPLGQAPLPDQGEWRPSLRSWIDFTRRTADRWEAEFDKREREWQDAEPRIRRQVKWLPNLSWATEIRGAYVDVLRATSAELNYGLFVYETAEVQELFKNTQRLEEILERTEPWFRSDGEAPRMAEIIDLQRAMAERVEEIKARSSESA